MILGAATRPSDDFSRFAESIAISKIAEDSLPYNFCPDCRIPMSITNSEYKCTNCSLNVKNETPVSDELDNIVNGSIRVTTGANRGKCYNVANDYSKTQKKAVIDHLMAKSAAYRGTAISPHILNMVATRYNNIQKFVTENELDENGNIAGQKKFVRRGSVKDEVLAALIDKECIREGTVRKKRDIAAFMGLATSGFARGEDILYDLQAMGKIELPENEDPVEGYTGRYLEALGIGNTYAPLISDIVTESERLRIGMNSQISSKVVGTIWLIIVKAPLPITAMALEKASDNTKKNTFVKFYNTILLNRDVFSGICAKHGITL